MPKSKHRKKHAVKAKAARKRLERNRIEIAHKAEMQRHYEQFTKLEAILKANAEAKAKEEV